MPGLAEPVPHRKTAPDDPGIGIGDSSFHSESVRKDTFFLHHGPMSHRNARHENSMLSIHLKTM
jgi:hypothetical protein